MTTPPTIRRLLVLLGLAALLNGSVGCPGEPTDGDADGDADGGPDADEDTDRECVPRTCMDIHRACGTYDDGCGGTIECLRGCECSAGSFAEDCPERPCERAVGCEERRCVYEPVSCGGAACICRAEECEEWTLRSCGEGVCAPSFCDPRPVRSGGEVRFDNACVDAPVAGSCGTCGLGRLVCDEANDRFDCDDITLAGVVPDMVECDSSLPTSSFVFVDPAFEDGGSDGSRGRPFTSYDEALSVAWGRGAVGVVVAGSAVTRGRLTLIEGISVYGGFDGAPHFRVSTEARPVWEVGLEHRTAEDVAESRLVGARAHGLEAPTVLSGLAIRTDTLAELEPSGPGISNYGLHVQGSPGLQLVDVVVEAGDAGPGADGAAGDSGRSGAAGGAGGAARSCACGSGLTGHEACYSTAVSGGTAGGATMCLDFSTPPETAGGAGGGMVFTEACETPRIDCGTPGSTSPGGAAGGDVWFYSGGGGGVRGTDAPAERPVQAGPGVVATEPTEVDGEPFLRPSPDGDGARGTRATRHGTGGGGGGSGQADDYPATDIAPYSWRTCTGIILGGGGGGGGAGGCAGDGGRGGRAGGVSIALFVARSDGMVLDGCELRAGDGGRGGEGGEGGAGGAGGAGGGAGPFSAELCALLGGGGCDPWDAGPGGRGGNGQPGGHGGNGVGGSSYGAYCEETVLALRRASRFEAGAAGLGGSFEARPASAGLSVEQRACVSDCGNGVIEPPEECDDGNREDGDGCESDCTLVCGSGTGAVRAARDSAGRCLAGLPGPLGWEEASLACIAAGGNLASVLSAEDFGTASTLFSGTSHWIGLSDRAEEGTYRWTTGETLSWTDGFCSGEPRASEAEDCVMSFWSPGAASHCWLVRACDVPLPFLCRLP